MQNKITIVQKSFKEKLPQLAVDFIAQESALSKVAIKRAMLCGALLVKKGGKGAFARVRKAKTVLNPNDYIQFTYKEEIIKQELDNPPSLIHKNRNYSIWLKPAHMPTQGNQYGDHLTLLRYVEKEFGECYLIQRLDQEASGLILIAHSKKSARLFSDLIKERKIEKRYRILVSGNVSTSDNFIKIDAPLDEKEAITLYRSIKSSNTESELDIQIETGRLHQIRRHMAHINHPVIGDRRYGEKSPQRKTLMLIASMLRFSDPFSRQERTFELAEIEIQKIFNKRDNEE